MSSLMCASILSRGLTPEERREERERVKHASAGDGGGGGSSEEGEREARTARMLSALDAAEEDLRSEAVPMRARGVVTLTRYGQDGDSGVSWGRIFYPLANQLQDSLFYSPGVSRSGYHGGCTMILLHSLQCTLPSRSARLSVLRADRIPLVTAMFCDVTTMSTGLCGRPWAAAPTRALPRAALATAAAAVPG